MKGSWQLRNLRLRHTETHQSTEAKSVTSATCTQFLIRVDSGIGVVDCGNHGEPMEGDDKNNTFLSSTTFLSRKQATEFESRLQYCKLGLLYPFSSPSLSSRWGC